MCRMTAVISDDPGPRTTTLRALRGLADRGFTGPATHRSHRDGWGIVGHTKEGLSFLGRSPNDASRDDAFDDGVALASKVTPGSVLIAHVRNASKGGRKVENTHPFIRDGWAFCHNGTIHGLEAPPGMEPEGDTDSERLFLHLLASKGSGESMEEAVRRIVPRIAESHKHSSLAFLLTDGRELLALRAAGPDPGSCGTVECALEHYTMGYGRFEDATVVFQEPEGFGELKDWNEVADGSMLHLAPGAPPRIIPVLRPERLQTGKFKVAIGRRT